MKELEGEYVRAIDELVYHHQKTIENINQVDDCMRKNVQVVLDGKGVVIWMNWARTRMERNPRNLKTDESDEGYQIMIANMENSKNVEW